MLVTISDFSGKNYLAFDNRNWEEGKPMATGATAEEAIKNYIAEFGEVPKENEPMYSMIDTGEPIKITLPCCHDGFTLEIKTCNKPFVINQARTITHDEE
jgi:hypothetical protein